jgi:TonB family protein
MLDKCRRTSGSSLCCLAVGLILGTQVVASCQERSLRASGERLRKDATYAPLPDYPRSALRAGRHGIVVVEVTVLPKGTVGNLHFMETFDKEVTEVVTQALNRWRFVSIENEPSGVRECPRIARLVFQFTVQGGTARVVDLAATRIDKNYRPGSLWPSLARD